MIVPANKIKGTALIDGDYRYYLTRRWDVTRPMLCWIMLNPSTADAFTNDHTIMKCMHYAQLWDFGGISVVNLFAFRTLSPLVLRQYAGDVIGPDNWRWVITFAAGARKIVCAWGAHGDYMKRGATVRNSLKDFPLYKLGTCLNGEPQHPLRLPYSRKLEAL